MVTAGIFMVARMSPLFELSDTALSFMMVIGAITALFMGFLGVVQMDIKRVVAYSTLSQLGYMTVALGASAYPVAVFHLMTHAFFKALLFLGAGSVIIGMHHDQDMRNMGGLWKYMPITWITSLVGSLALIGTPFFAGFYSKDSIIDAAHLSHLPGSSFAYFAVAASVFVTALYSFRMYFMVFHGKERFRGPKHPDSPMGAEEAAHGHDDSHGHDDHGHHGPHVPQETSWVVWVPLVLLAIPSVIIGAIGIGPMLYGDFFSHGIRHCATWPRNSTAGSRWASSRLRACPCGCRSRVWWSRGSCISSVRNCRRRSARRSRRSTRCSTTSTTWTRSTRSCLRAAPSRSVAACGRKATSW
jgi:NADH-quinone oxidoreductase subunit L